MSIEKDSIWHKDAIIYQLHVRVYSDSNGDGIGDFAGLASKLDYLQELGINTLWLLPFYPSPLRDDGYDISDYRNIHPDYGTLNDFRYFLREAHRRGIRVIIELVINHTSDQHPWFQAARSAPPRSTKRKYYVWSDTIKKYEGTRIIFTDYEKSNWAWDEEAKAYYWHRFFSHQPDLNFDNPHVIKALLRAMRFWFDMGVDGMRLDAIPYLCERDGTNNENLPETHAVIEQFRAALDEHYEDRVFLAEANQWPEDVREYFGDGDQCHMAFHFPLMPRIFMAVALEDRHPITEILAQTPDIPSNCQWAIFLRNHDELTLEMVTDRERDYMYDTYASDPRARINLGIRRRLAPLMDGNRAKLELMNSLLLSMPGSPIIYYGDEIGMGDNIYLGDRNSVRTPMQWSPDRNAGFSRADPQKLYLPLIMDPVYGHEAVNVEAQSRSASSLLNWMRRMIATRKSFKAFGRGSISFLKPGNRKILAYLRIYENEQLLCVVNLADSAQPVELELSAYKGRVPVELLGRTTFPAIGELPYLLTLPAYGFYWFRLAEDAEAPVWHVDKLPREELPVLVFPDGLLNTLIPQGAGDIQNVFKHKTRTQLENVILPAYIKMQRWYSGATDTIKQVELILDSEWRTEEGNQWLPLFARVTTTAGLIEHYFIPLGLLLEQAADEQYYALSPWMLAKIRQRAHTGMLYDALGDDRFCRQLLDAINKQYRKPFADGQFVFSKTSALHELAQSANEIAVVRPSVQQSNTSIVYGEDSILKVYRKIQKGINPEIEIGRFLTEHVSCTCVVPLLGAIEYRTTEDVMAIAVLHRYVENQGTAWDYTREYLDRYLTLCINEKETASAPDLHAIYQNQMQTLGKRTADLHRALASASDNHAFTPEPLTKNDHIYFTERLRLSMTGLFDNLSQLRSELSEDQLKHANIVLELKHNLLDISQQHLPLEPPLFKMRIHNNYHLGQALITLNDFVITDFEGDPDRPFAERRSKQHPLKDVASMLYSLALTGNIALQPHIAERPELSEQLQSFTVTWLSNAMDGFISGYRTTINGCEVYPGSPAQVEQLITLYILERHIEALQRSLEDNLNELSSSVRLLVNFINNTHAFYGSQL